MVLTIGPLYMHAAAAGLPDFTGLVDDYGESVVNISTVKKADQDARSFNREIPLPEGTPFDEFFRKYFGDQGRGFEPREARSLGSGFIISDNGYVVTNHHVVKNADEIIVRLQDRRELEAELIGSDERSDIALLRIKARNLPNVKLGSADKLKVGEWVLAIGSPFGFEHSVTAGIVSAKGRSLPADNYVPFIQTDVAINPGNSGGPLFNMDGEVVGVNSQIYSRTGGFMGLSFSIPIDVAINVVDQLKKQGKVSRGWLGVQVQDVTRELAESFGMGRPRGALIAKVLPDSPAEKANFQLGDVIIEFNGKKVDTSSALPPLVGITPIDSTVNVKVVRKGKTKTLKVQVGLLSEELETQLAEKRTGAVNLERLGLLVSDLTEEDREQFQVLKDGVLVQSVNPGPGSNAGIQKGDVILRVRNKVIDNVKDLQSFIKGLPKKKSISLLLQRRGSPFYTAIKLDD